MSIAFQNIAQTRQHFGWKAALQRAVSRSAQKLLRLEVNEMLWLDAGCLPASIESDPEFQFRFLTAKEVSGFAADPKNDLDASFAVRATRGLDLCFAAIASGGQLASYSWYASGSIEPEHHLGVAMSLPTDVAYMYKAFTHPDYRGRRLYAATVALALKNLAHRGVTKLVTTIEWTNFASLRGCRRLGFQELGRLSTIGPTRHRIAFTSRAAKSRGICFGSSATVPQRK